MADLPPEIWLHILSFVSSKDLKRLYGLNRMFLNLALDERYGKITLMAASKEREEKILKYWKHLTEPYIVPHISHLRVCLDFSFTPASKGMKTALSSVAHTMRVSSRYPFDGYMRGTLITRFQNDSQFNIRLTKLLKRLSFGNVTTLSLYLSEELIWKKYHCKDFLAMLFTSISKNLHTLRLGRVPYRIAELMVPAPSLPALHTLILDTSGDPLYPVHTDHREVSIKLARIINTYSKTVKSLRLVLDPESVHLQPLFHNLETFPFLHTLSIRVENLENWGYTMHHASIHNFMSRHVTNLRSLETHLHVSSTPLAELQTVPANALSLSFLPLKFGHTTPELIAAYIKPSVNTLHSLSLDYAPLDADTVTNILTLFPTLCPLSYLRLRISYLNPRLIHFLAQRFRFLENLDIESTMIVSEEWHDRFAERTLSAWIDRDAYKFHDQVRELQLPKWGLRIMDIWLIEKNYSVRDLCKLTRVIPSLEELRIHAGRKPGFSFWTGFQ